MHVLGNAVTPPFQGSSAEDAVTHFSVREVRFMPLETEP